MWTLIILVALVVLGIYLQKKYNPAFKKQGGVWYLHYNASTGARNQHKLF